MLSGRRAAKEPQWIGARTIVRSATLVVVHCAAAADRVTHPPMHLGCLVDDVLRRMAERVISEKPTSDWDPDRRKHHQRFNAATGRLTPYFESQFQGGGATKPRPESRSADRSSYGPMGYNRLDLGHLAASDGLLPSSGITDGNLKIVRL
jgi:hypothetical protein